MSDSYVIDDRCIPEVERVLHALVNERRAPSYAYGIFGPQGLIHAGIYGTVDTLAQAGPDSSAGLRFRIASMSKSFTAAAVLTLVARGQLDLHAPITALIPEMSHVKPFEDDSFPITVADLLSMRSGLATDDSWADRQESMPRSGLLNLLTAGINTVFSPGEGYEYSNLGYAVLGELIRRVTGMDARDYVREQLLEPLDLKETTYDYRDVDPAMLVCGHHLNIDGTWERETFSAPGAFSPIGGIVSSVRDMARWCTWLAQAWNNSGAKTEAVSTSTSIPASHKASGKAPTPGTAGVSGSLPDAVLPRRYRRLMQIGHTPIPTTLRSGSSRGRLTRSDTTHIESYGFGLVVEYSPRFGNIAHHSGGYPGYGSDMRWHLGSGIGIVVLANGRYATPSVVASRALDVLLSASVPTDDNDTRSLPSHATPAVVRPRSPGVAARDVRLWPETVEAMRLVRKVVQYASDAGGGDAACLQGLKKLDDMVSMNIPLDRSPHERAQRLAAVLSITGPVSAGMPAIAETTAESPAQLSWTMPCERHPMRCAIRLDPLLPPRIQSLEFTVADKPATDDITIVEPRNNIVWQ